MTSLPRIHAMIKINWNVSTNEEKNVNDLLKASILDIGKLDEIQRLIDGGLLKEASG